MVNKGFLGGLHPAAKLVFTLIVALTFSFVVIFAGTLLIMPFVHVPLDEFLAGSLDLTAPENLLYGKFMQIFFHMGLFILSSIFLAWAFGKKVPEYLYMKRSTGIEVFFLAVIIVFAAVPFINYILELNMQLKLPDFMKSVEDWIYTSEQQAEKVTQAYLQADTISILLFNIFMIAIIPALGEEFMFRGVILRVLKDWTRSASAAIWLSAILFSFIHMQFLGFIPRMILGILFGYMVVWSGSIWPAVVAHFINNAAAVIFFYLFQHQFTDGTLENVGKGSGGVYFAVVSVLVTLGLMWMFRKKSQAARPDTQTLF
ncbi:MAG: lysostaphin resistance A-like protein [Bacteroidales bacterium]